MLNVYKIPVFTSQLTHRSQIEDKMSEQAAIMITSNWAQTSIGITLLGKSIGCDLDLEMWVWTSRLPVKSPYEQVKVDKSVADRSYKQSPV